MHPFIFLAFLGLSLFQGHHVAAAPHVVVHEVGDAHYEFHATHHLLLAIGEACHVIHVSEVMRQQLSTKAGTTQLLDDINYNYIKTGANQKEISLHELRDMFHDMYANFQCIGKYVYEVMYTEVTSSSSASPPSMAPSSSAGSKMTSVMPTPMGPIPIPS